MKGYRKSSGVYVELNDTVPVSVGLVEVALRPSPDHVFADAWQTAPKDPAVCWRTKTAGEVNNQKDAELQAFFDTAGGKALKALATALIKKGVVTLAEIRTEYRAL